MKYLKVSFYLFIIFLMSSTSFAATKGKIAGLVTDKETGDPLPGVNVLVKGTLLGASTGLDGTFFIVNVPVGTYELEVSYIGYQTVTVQNVRVQTDLTTRQNLELAPAVMELGEEIVVIAEKPIIQTDLTASRTTMSTEDIQAIPFENVEAIVNITPGFVDGHARGGRDGEVSYQIDGVTIMDPMTRAFDADIPEFAVEEISVITGGFGTEYGDAQSGVVSMVIKEGGTNYSGNFRYKTSDFSKISEKLTDHHALQNFEFSFGGPEPLSSTFGYKDKLRFFIAGEYRRDNGRLPQLHANNLNIESKFSWTPNQYHKVTLAYGGNWGDFGLLIDTPGNSWRHRYSRTTYEDRNPLMANRTDELSAWYNNGQLDTEDLNGNGVLDPGEDLNGNGLLESEDLDHDGKLSKHNMYDHLPDADEFSNHIILNWTYQLNSKSFFEFKLSQSITTMKYNIDENINEDSDGDGHLDLAWDMNGDGVVDDVDGDGDFRHEDLNGNNEWDWKLDNGETDLFVDNNNNGYIDASENGARDTWMLWEEAPFGNSQDNDGFYTYGEGLTFYRLRWNYDEKITRTAKMAYYNQVNNHNEIKVGIEGTMYDLRDHDIDLASGGNVYGQNIEADPYSFAAFAEDKMEYEGMIMNFGLRLDYFNANSKSPKDPENPFVVTNGQLGYQEVVDTKAKWFVSPRLGISHPISTRDVIYFNYGRFFQMPQLTRLYTNSSFQLVGAFPIIGNPNMDPETTTSYELGVKHAFSDDMKLEVKGFYKDIQGLTDLSTYYYNAANWAGFYTNLDYGNTRGFEIQFTKRYSRYWSGTVNYTYSIAKGKSSTATQNYNYTWSGDVIPTEEFFLNWDQRHTVNTNLNFRIPYDENLLGTSLFNDMGLNMVFKYGSGLPYSSEARTEVPPINDQRLPANYDLDMIFDKTLNLAGNYRIKFFFWANNLMDDLFNHVNINDLKEVSYYDQDQDGDGQPDRNPKGRYNDPTAYTEGSTYRVGIQFDF